MSARLKILLYAGFIGRFVYCVVSMVLLSYRRGLSLNDERRNSIMDICYCFTSTPGIWNLDYEPNRRIRQCME